MPPHNPVAVDIPLLTFLYGHTLKQMNDQYFVFDLITHLARNTKRHRSSRLIHKPAKQGVAHLLGRLAVEDFFKALLSEWGQPRAVGDPVAVYVALEAAISFVGYPSRAKFRFRRVLDRLTTQRWSASTPDAFMQLELAAEYELFELASYVRRTKRFVILRDLYTNEIADRILHDRLVCWQIAHHLVWLAPNPTETGSRKFVTRCRWPAFALKTVFARDRGKCSSCNVDMGIELLAQSHIDHIVPLSQGGCNDLVNLQLLCRDCNLNKGACHSEPNTSVPRYHASALSEHCKPWYHWREYNE